MHLIYKAVSTDVYTLTFNFSLSSVWEKELNENFTTATPVEVENVYYGTTSSGYDYERDYYSVNVPKDGNYNIQFDTPNQQSSDGVWRVYLFDSAYNELENMVIYGNKTTHQISRRLEADIYYICVESTSYYKAVSTDPYELLVTKPAKKSQ